MQKLENKDQMIKTKKCKHYIDEQTEQGKIIK